MFIIYIYILDSYITFYFDDNSKQNTLTGIIDNEVKNLKFEYKINITNCDKGEVLL